MTYDELEYVVGRLRPIPRFTNRFGTSKWTWDDVRPYPTEQEITDEFAVWQAEKVKKVIIDQAYKDYNNDLEAGYTDANGITWYCNERATMDLAMMVVLNSLEAEEPVYVLSMSHGVQEMTYNSFLALSVAIGRHAYDIRKTLWTTLLNA